MLIEQENFDFGFWNEEEIYKPQSDEEILQQVQENLDSGETSIDELTQHEYELVVSAHNRQLSENVRRFLRLNAPYDPHLFAHTPSYGHMLTVGNRLRLHHAATLSSLRKQDKVETAKLQKQFTETKHQRLLHNKQLVEKMKENHRIATEKLKAYYIYIPPDKKLNVLKAFLHGLSKNYEMRCDERERNEQIKMKYAQLLATRWQEVLQSVKNPTQQIGKAWEGVFHRDVTPDPEALSLAGASLRDPASERHLAEIVAVNPCFSSSQLLQIEEWVLNAAISDEMTSSLFGVSDVERDVKHEINKQIQTINQNYECRAVLKEIENMIEIGTDKQNSKFDPESLLNKWLNCQKRQQVHQEWFEVYQSLLQIFDKYLKLAFELEIQDSNFTLDDLKLMSIKSKEPKLLVYKKSAENDLQINARRQHEQETLQVENRRVKVTRIPPSHPKIVARVRQAIVPAVSSSRETCSDSYNLQESDKETDAAEQPQKPPTMDVEYKAILNQVLQAIDIVTLENQKLVDKFIMMSLEQYNNNVTNIHRDNHINSAVSTRKVNKNKRRMKIEQLKIKKVKEQRHHEEEQIEYRKFKFLVLSKTFPSTIPPTRYKFRRQVEEYSRSKEKLNSHTTMEFNSTSAMLPNDHKLSCRRVTTSPSRLATARIGNRRKRDVFIEGIDLKIERSIAQASIQEWLVEEMGNSTK